MDELLQDARTVAIKACAFCGSGLLERDKFCRWCGARQPEEFGSGLNSALITQSTPGAISSPVNAARVIAGAARADVYHRVSGPLVTAVVSGALATPSTENQSAFVKRVILALISIPIWLIIVLLSPLDAYAAVKNLARQV